MRLGDLNLKPLLINTVQDFETVNGKSHSDKAHDAVLP